MGFPSQSTTVKSTVTNPLRLGRLASETDRVIAQSGRLSDEQNGRDPQDGMGLGRHVSSER